MREMQLEFQLRTFYYLIAICKLFDFDLISRSDICKLSDTDPKKVSMPAQAKAPLLC